MKIGILTFHCAHNYGAVLQCYALQEFLKGLGHDVEIIDYRPNYLLAPYKIFKASRTGSLIFRIKSFIKSLLTLRRSYIRHKKFYNFINNYLNLSKERNHIPDKYDVYITGSDQIWNPQITNGFDSNYFAEYSFPKGHKIYISYAASMEAKKLSDLEANYYKNHLNNFDFISVREKTLSDLLQPLTNKKITTVLDPTLIVDKKAWDRLAILPKNKHKYILVYQVRTHKCVLKIAKKIADKFNAKIIEIGAWVDLYDKKYREEGKSPEEFIGYVKNSLLVITTSFHGTIFSIINEKPFYYIDLGINIDSRVRSLLNDLNLESRIILKDSDFSYSSIDYSEVKYKLHDNIVLSRKYLAEILNINKND